jgi:hypothetical protein
MILPSKHIRLSESLLGLGGVLLGILTEPKSADQIWFDYLKVNNKQKFPAYHNYDNVILALNYLFIIGIIDVDLQGKLYHATS